MTDSPSLPVLDVSTRENIVLGQPVREKVTGFSGIVTAIIYEIDGTIFIGVQPRELEDGKPAEVQEFDIERIEGLPGDRAILNKEGDAIRQSIRLGAIYTDRVTGLKGVAVRRIDFLGGCTRILLRPKVGKDNKIVDGIMIPVEQAELVDEKPAIAAEKNATRTGGPGSSDRAMMARMSR